jgi:hypothetical protein
LVWELESHRYGEYLFRYGIAAPEHRQDKLREEVRKGAITPIRDPTAVTRTRSRSYGRIIPTRRVKISMKI